MTSETAPPASAGAACPPHEPSAEFPPAGEGSAPAVASPPPTVTLSFEGGTVVATGLAAPLGALAEAVISLRPEPRGAAALGQDTARYRAPAVAYRAMIEWLTAHGVAVRDTARAWSRRVWEPRVPRPPLEHQAQALAAWWSAGGRGVVVLPTGTGKTHLAIMAMAKANRPSLIVVPTLDLMSQWHGELSLAFAETVGLIGGGHHDPRDLCVTTYDSAYLHLDRLGNRWGLLIFDECHHLPGATIRQAALCSMAGFRLGLTATPERPDGAQAILEELIGPVVYRRGIAEMAGSRLAPYSTQTCWVHLDEADRAAYAAARTTYRAFVEQHGLRLSRPGDWGRFLMLGSRSAAGRAALMAYRRQRELAAAAPAKLAVLETLLIRHRADRCLVFAADNATVYAISRAFLLPAITHQTAIRERREILDGFNTGVYPAIVTAKVLNEGVNVPAANVAVIMSGSASVREHVQRLGRILRPAADKTATLYELVTADTAEEFVSERRRQHEAYQAHDGGDGPRDAPPTPPATE